MKTDDGTREPAAGVPEQEAGSLPAETQEKSCYCNLTRIRKETAVEYRKSVFGRKFVLVLSACLVAFAGGIVLLALGKLVWAGWLLVVIFGILAALLGLSFLLGKTAWGKGPDVWRCEADYRFRFDDSGCEVECTTLSGTEESEGFRYEELLRAEESRNFFALFRSADRYLVVDKRSFEGEDAGACIAMISGKLGKRWYKVSQ